MALTNKQQAFVDEYLRDFNATQAAIRAGYSERTAAVIGHENLRKPNIAEAIARIVEQRSMSRDEVLIRLAEQARADIADFVRSWDRGFTIDLHKAIESGKSHLVKKVGYNQYGQPEIELHNQQRALELLGKAHGVFTDRVEHTGPGGGDLKIRLTWGDDADTDAGTSETT